MLKKQSHSFDLRELQLKYMYKSKMYMINLTDHSLNSFKTRSLWLVFPKYIEYPSSNFIAIWYFYLWNREIDLALNGLSSLYPVAYRTAYVQNSLYTYCLNCFDIILWRKIWNINKNILENKNYLILQKLIISKKIVYVHMKKKWRMKFSTWKYSF